MAIYWAAKVGEGLPYENKINYTKIPFQYPSSSVQF